MLLVEIVDDSGCPPGTPELRYPHLLPIIRQYPDKVYSMKQSYQQTAFDYLEKRSGL